ncbi:STAS domain-containing protein [Actinoplanes sp. NBC_00393]|uniref:STAS domain-containing protein n=1 Tax=Actinoplanes sp. NBC_00393 TaxID=2975953 RepID=UPI002E228889
MLEDYFAIAADPARADDDGVVTSRVRLSGEFDIDSREELRDALLEVITAGECARLLVDLDQVRFIDSEALSALIESYLAAESAGIAFQLVGAHGIVKQVITVAGLEHLFGGTGAP